MPTRSPDSFHQIADTLSKSLKQAFDEVCPERYGSSLTIERADMSAEDPTVSLQIKGSDRVDVQIHLTLSHVGGNVYDIVAQVEDGPTRRFTYSEPDSSGSSLSIAPYLGKKIARHLLDEVEQQLGKAMLREQILSGA